LRKNNFTFSHPIFRPSLPAPQSQNPRNSNTVPVVLLNRPNQIWPKFGRQFREVIFTQALSLISSQSFFTYIGRDFSCQVESALNEQRSGDVFKKLRKRNEKKVQGEKKT